MCIRDRHRANLVTGVVREGSVLGLLLCKITYLQTTAGRAFRGFARRDDVVLVVERLEDISNLFDDTIDVIIG